MIMHRYNAEGTNTPSVVGVPCLLGLSLFWMQAGIISYACGVTPNARQLCEFLASVVVRLPSMGSIISALGAVCFSLGGQVVGLGGYSFAQ